MKGLHSPDWSWPGLTWRDLHAWTGLYMLRQLCSGTKSFYVVDFVFTGFFHKNWSTQNWCPVLAHQTRCARIMCFYYVWLVGKQLLIRCTLSSNLLAVSTPHPPNCSLPAMLLVEISLIVLMYLLGVTDCSSLCMRTKRGQSICEDSMCRKKC